MMLLRRSAYNLLALFQSVTHRSDETCRIPWRTLMKSVYNAVVGATQEQVEGLRMRRLVAIPNA